MSLLEGIEEDLDFIHPKIYISGRIFSVENVSSIISLEPDKIVIKSRTVFTSIYGTGFRLHEICERRILVEGSIHKVEFLQP